jgi:hypothetical protein
METPGVPDTGPSKNDRLLAETSNVLQRISNILEMQEQRMKELDTKIITLRAAHATCPNIAAGKAALEGS